MRILLLVCLILLAGGLYWHGAVQQLTSVNTNMIGVDQSAYMDYARRMRESGYTYIGDRNRMPVYPFLQSLLYRPGMSDEAFFTQGKFANLILSMILLGALTIIMRSLLPLWAAANLTLITAFQVFIFRAGFFQTELLFYFESFLLFLLMLRFLHRPSLGTAVLIGLISGLAHLTKASVLPALALFLITASFQVLWRRLTATERSSEFVVPARTSLAAILLAVVVFLVTVWPYISTSKRVFGQYFYNVNATFYLWYDSWDEAKAGTRAHGDRVGWPDLPPEQIPSLSKYLQEHSSQQIADRLVQGARVVIRRMVHSYGYFKYMLIYLSLLAIAGIGHRRRVVEAFKRNPFPYSFVAAYLVAYYLLYAWYTPIASGNRLTLALFLPFMAATAVGWNRLLALKSVSIGPRSWNASCLANAAISLLLIPDIYLVLTERILTIHGGT